MRISLSEIDIFHMTTDTVIVNSTGGGVCCCFSSGGSYGFFCVYLSQ